MAMNIQELFDRWKLQLIAAILEGGFDQVEYLTFGVPHLLSPIPEVMELTNLATAYLNNPHYKSEIIESIQSIVPTLSEECQY